MDIDTPQHSSYFFRIKSRGLIRHALNRLAQAKMIGMTLIREKATRIWESYAPTDGIVRGIAKYSGIGFPDGYGRSNTVRYSRFGATPAVISVNQAVFWLHSACLRQNLSIIWILQLAEPRQA
jgi:hypothetical protein